MTSKKLAFQLNVILVVVAGLIGLVFLVFIPSVGNQFRLDSEEYAKFFIPFLIWVIVASIPLFYTVFLLYKVVRRVAVDAFFEPENYQNIYSVSKIIRWDVIVNLVLFTICLFSLDVNPGFILVCAGLALMGILISKFFELLALWIEKGTEIKIENELTI